jgi:hypothetical protein
MASLPPISPTKRHPRPEGGHGDLGDKTTMNLRQELADWLDTQIITGDNIGDVRRACFVPWDSQWNGVVRDETAAREGKPPRRSAGQWWPIESCPRDGTNFLACSTASSVFFAHYANGVVDSSDYSEDGGYRARHATHWMPLPAGLTTA